ncbi:aminotransferase class I/II-fold pyridoxal phosphate-dependent enzyme [Pallidibacillus thermolactis]|jgi:arginine decarboxylase|uniref:aminotransferase class I/II-fold pyridoxal phosphate-dependent enzyme n=1 Tax=Pallidibacillus thermolactis TaxID=251051 RepID=UPI00156BA10C|nr:aminotransferase class I/II-fold pyridoxal phosphate-dependent enzyme [Pallidibacillus thermolactis]MCU9601785.1 aminotransferase class I/II-fold pyridoxal phosphate-dependent enzyme [Pallidibacillus thermolactis subsp. kokeshiiformis]MED1674547.1 aminotransferase class I/II-fold pyridoxal phosphate-dependent enzyme [Pallidibacillus thermolactis subsp. kokeshiiformis]
MNEVKEFSTQRTSHISQEQMPLFNALVNYANSDVVPFDVPGHKMGAMMNPLKKALGEMALRMDVNSMKELDLLSHPKSVIKEAQELAAEAFGADHAYFLVNGTTVGIQAMIMAVCKPNEKIIVPRNGHKSVMDGIILSGANPVFIQPEVDYHFGISHGVSVENVDNAIKAHPDAKALLITYPTYFGTMTDLTKICTIAHEHDITVIVDSAHGAHLNFVEMVDPISAGADAVTISMHKTGGSLTQSSLLLLKKNRIKPEKIQKLLSMLQSTSANYLLMSSLDVARRELVLYGKERYHRLKPIVEKAIREIESETHFEILKDEYVSKHFHQTHDWTKLVIRVNGIGLTGFDVYTLLKKKYGIQMELAEGYVVMAVITSSDTEYSIGKLVSALKDIDNNYGEKMVVMSPHVTTDQVNELILSPREAFYCEHEQLAIDDSIGRVSADTLMIYPPGIPLVIPGELISQEVVKQYHYYRQLVGDVLTEAKEKNYITVVKEKI